MNTELKRLIKLLRQHQATLHIDPTAQPPEILLSVTEQRDANGNLTAYATTYRLGIQCPPQAAPEIPLTLP